MATTSNLFMYSLTIQPPSAITQAVLGQFAGTKEQQIITASGTNITLYRVDAQAQRITTTLSHNAFGVIRTLAPFRLAGSNKGTSQKFAILQGCIVILQVRDQLHRIAPRLQLG